MEAKFFRIIRGLSGLINCHLNKNLSGQTLLEQNEILII